MIGCIADVYSPDFGKKFAKQYPEMYNPEFDAFKALHATEIGKFALMCNFGLMNSTTNVIKLIRFLERAQGPYDLLEENYHTYDFHKRYKELYSELERLMNKAKDTEEVAQDVLYFKYGGPTSMSAILSSKLYFENPDKLIVVAYKRPEKINLSIRGKNALEVTNKIVEKVDGATGGGHPEATGAMIPALEEEAFEGVIKNLRQ